jgi:hypothetical protein
MIPLDLIIPMQIGRHNGLFAPSRQGGAGAASHRNLTW